MHAQLHRDWKAAAPAACAEPNTRAETPFAWKKSSIIEGEGGHQGNSFKATAAPALCGGIIRCLSLTPEDSKNTEGTLPLGQRVVFGRVYVIRRERQPPNLWRAPQL